MTSQLIDKKVRQLERLIELDNRQRDEMFARIMGKLAELRAVGLAEEQVQTLERAARKRSRHK